MPGSMQRTIDHLQEGQFIGVWFNYTDMEKSGSWFTTDPTLTPLPLNELLASEQMCTFKYKYKH